MHLLHVLAMSTGEDLNCGSNYDVYFAKGLLNVASFAHFSLSHYNMNSMYYVHTYIQ